MKKAMMVATLMLTALIALSLQSVLAVEYREKTQYLGVVNGQVVNGGMVRVSRLPSDPILYRSSKKPLPEQLLVRNANVRPASDGLAYITVKQSLSDGLEARITLKTALMVDGQKASLSARQQGEDVVIMVPESQQLVELRTDAPAEVEIPANYRGNVQLSLQVED
ncbi:TPA: fimbrial protein [Escherichia coli]|nr:fimbrial protein [Escherichia coli]EID6494402.1 DUF5462 family protein [Escherichia coli]QXB75336.1 DUF5462 family protein [Escherichia coli]QXC28348.1 DUF5462 family protein [Escherichia coli]HAJ7213908.1 fimbrial protein [Escherichia coli]